jgi:hypothetical protein
MGAVSMSAHAQQPTPVTKIVNSAGDSVLVSYEGGGLAAFGELETSPIPAEGAGVRLMWHPAKAAFRAGEDITGFWNDANIGTHSVAFGIDTKASGPYSTAMGGTTTAKGEYSTALGQTTVASGDLSTALGNETTASGSGATAMGGATTASGTESTAMGSATTASGNQSTAMGSETTAGGESATAMGRLTSAGGNQSTTMGFSTDASGDKATAMGSFTEASGENATAMGDNTVAATDNSLSIGSGNDANTSADNTLFVASSDVQTDALVLDQSGNLTISGTLTESSDRRLKTEVEPMDGGTLQKLADLRPVRYRFKDQDTHPSGLQIGLVAQDVRSEFPALVSEGSGGYLSLAYPKLSAVLVKGLQEQQAMLRDKQAQIDTLKQRVQQVESLRTRVARLEADGGVVPARVPFGSLALLALGGLLGAGLLHLRRSRA